ncbi:MAG TPA: HAD family hydrolase [Trichocoleus sp.]|jgi:sugar-phosphatase
MATINCAAVLFDLDGTLVDSTPCVERLWRNWAIAHGLDAEALLQISHGRPTIDTMRLVAPQLNVGLDIATEARQLDELATIDLEGVIEAPGASHLLQTIPPEAWAIVTSGNIPIATSRLAHVGLSIPEVLITTEAVSHYKPHPEGYLKAAQRLGIAPEACIVIEDAPVGIQAAQAAGMRSIAVATTYPARELAANWCVSSLDCITVGRVDRLPNGEMAIELILEDNS